MVEWKYETGLSIGKCRLTQILLNMRKRLFFQKKERKKKKYIPGTHPSLFFNNSVIEYDTTQKHLGWTLDHKLVLQYHVNEKIERNWSSSKTTFFFTSKIFTDYLQIVYKTTIGLRWCSLWSAFKWCFF